MKCVLLLYTLVIFLKVTNGNVVSVLRNVTPDIHKLQLSFDETLKDIGLIIGITSGQLEEIVQKGKNVLESRREELEVFIHETNNISVICSTRATNSLKKFDTAKLNDCLVNNDLKATTSKLLETGILRAEILNVLSQCLKYRRVDSETTGCIKTEMVSNQNAIVNIQTDLRKRIEVIKRSVESCVQERSSEQQKILEPIAVEFNSCAMKD